MSADTDFQTRMTVLADLVCELSAILGQDPMQGLREALRRRRKSRGGRRSRSRGGRPGGRRGRGRWGNRAGGDFGELEDPQMVQGYGYGGYGRGYTGYSRRRRRTRGGSSYRYDPPLDSPTGR